MDPTNLVVLRGTLSSEPSSRTLPSGSVLVTLNVTTQHADGARSVPVAWFDPPAKSLARLTSGTELVAVGYVRRRFFRGGGATQSRTEVVVERLALPTARRDVERLLQLIVEKLTSSSEGL